MKFTHLFTPLEIRHTEIKNRIFSTGHQTRMTRDGLPTGQMRAYHEARARGGAGLVILEAARVQGSDFVFGGFAEELKAFYRRDPRKVHHANMVLDFSPDRMKALMQKHIKKWCKAMSA